MSYLKLALMNGGQFLFNDSNVMFFETTVWFRCLNYKISISISIGISINARYIITCNA